MALDSLFACTLISYPIGFVALSVFLVLPFKFQFSVLYFFSCFYSLLRFVFIWYKEYIRNVVGGKVESKYEDYRYCYFDQIEKRRLRTNVGCLLHQQESNL